jgi:hypothetical protein
MGCRRKLKKERELVADINKVFRNFCDKMNCRDCPYVNSDDCKVEYIKELLKRAEEEEDEE